MTIISARKNLLLSRRILHTSSKKIRDRLLSYLSYQAELQKSCYVDIPLNRQQLADHAKVSRTSIRCWENGQKTIGQKCFCHLVENLGSDFPSMLRM